METTIEAQLSSELQELYLENKEWLSTILFLEDEMRFAQQIFKKVLLLSIPQSNFEQIEFVKLDLFDLQERRKQLKEKVDNRHKALETLFKQDEKIITLAFIEEDVLIVAEIKALLAANIKAKNELFALKEALKPKH